MLRKMLIRFLVVLVCIANGFPEVIPVYAQAGIIKTMPVSGDISDASGTEIVSKAEKERLLKQLKKKQSSIKTFTAWVIQKKKLKLLSKTIESDGRLYLKRPLKLKWVTLKPEKVITVLNNHTLTVYHPEEKEAQVYNIKRDFILNKSISFFQAFMQGRLSDMEDDFFLRLFYDKDSDVLIFRLAPKNSIARKYISYVEIRYLKTKAIPIGMLMVTPGGDKTVTIFREPLVNIKLQDSLFDLKLPSDVWITNRIEDEDDGKEGCCF